MVNGTEHLTTVELQQILQREVDLARNEGRRVSEVVVEFGLAGTEETVPPGDIQFFKGRFIALRYGDATSYIPVEMVNSIVFKYGRDNGGDQNEQAGRD